MKALFAAAALATASLIASPAHAEEERETGFYVQVFGGTNIAQEQDLTPITGPLVEIDFDQGLTDGAYVVGGAIGWTAIANKLGRARLEAEFSFRGADVNRGVVGVNSPPFFGDVTVGAGLLNLVYDTPSINSFFGTSLRGYVGAGVGLGSIDYDVGYFGGPTGTTIINIEDSDAELAYQFFVGSEWRLTKHWSLVGDVRYFGLTEPEVTRVNSVTGAPISTLLGEHRSIAFTSGVRLNF